MDNCSLLLSIHPQYANLIFAGTKTVELRKIRPKHPEIDWIFVYATTPVQAIIGVCRVERYWRLQQATFGRLHEKKQE